ncbi:helix-turn-helix domain-containing protein [Paenibacillus alkalitolerans]|uniref:helix-turn-helix domain-containing protein n=1 Tax=Paenibacillus alkalitolerans TaxID=2799335 RepID=UPI0018F492AA|nr:helix-turn-helix domain-containing protein [Paenibacillus alkalitolerans]
MRFLKPMNTVFYRLIFSYFLLIVITTIFMGITSYVYFTKNFNEEIEKVNGRMLAYLKKITDENIFRETQRIYIDITMAMPENDAAIALFHEPVEGNHARISQVNQYLKEISSRHSDLIDSIQVYYRENNLIISSMHGVEFLEHPGSEPAQWLEVANKQYKGALSWYHFGDSVALIGSYPFANTGESQGYIAILLKKRAITELLTESAAKEAGRLIIVGPDGVVGHEPNDQVLTLAQNHIKEIQMSDTADHFYLTEIGGIKAMISYTSLRPGWKLVNITPVDEFYNKTVPIQRTILLICLVALAIGVVISNVFTVNIYNPLKLILDRARTWFHEDESAAKHANEYHMINSVIDNLSVKVGDLEKTLKGNLPLIKNKLADDLLKGKIESTAQINERLALIHAEPVDVYSYYCVISLHLDETDLRNINTENSEFIKYNLIDQIENGHLFQGRCLAIEHENRIHIAVFSKQKNADAVHHVINSISSYAYSNFMLSVVGAVGSWATNPLKLNESFQENRILLKYRYFKPKQRIIFGYSYLEREKSKKELDSSFCEDFAKALKLRDQKKADEAIRRFTNEISSGMYSAEYGQEKIKDFLYEYYSYVKNMNISTREVFDEELLLDFYQFDHIDQYKAWLMNVVKTTFDYIDDKQKHKNADMIDKIKAYIVENPDKDLSLNAVAEIVNLSPRYLSRIFKQETGENFVDFVTTVRMHKAGELIRSSELPIEQIAMQVSYNNPAYFAKKFKETFGMTPTSYRMKESSSHDSQYL